MEGKHHGIGWNLATLLSIAASVSHKKKLNGDYRIGLAILELDITSNWLCSVDVDTLHFCVPEGTQEMNGPHRSHGSRANLWQPDVFCVHMQ